MHTNFHSYDRFCNFLQIRILQFNIFFVMVFFFLMDNTFEAHYNIYSQGPRRMFIKKLRVVE